MTKAVLLPMPLIEVGSPCSFLSGVYAIELNDFQTYRDCATTSVWPTCLPHRQGEDEGGSLIGRRSGLNCAVE